MPAEPWGGQQARVKGSGGVPPVALLKQVQPLALHPLLPLAT